MYLFQEYLFISLSVNTFIVCRKSNQCTYGGHLSTVNMEYFHYVTRSKKILEKYSVTFHPVTKDSM